MKTKRKKLILFISLFLSACGAQPGAPAPVSPAVPPAASVIPATSAQPFQGRWQSDNSRFVCGSTIQNAGSIRLSNIAGIDTFTVTGNQITMNGGTSQITSVLPDQFTISSGYGLDSVYYRFIGNTLAIRTRSTAMFDMFCNMSGQVGSIYAVFNRN